MILEKIIPELLKIVSLPFSMLLEPSKRLFYPFLISGLLICFIVFIIEKRKGNFLNYVFNKKVWFSNSTWVDCCLIFFNTIIKVVIISPLFVISIYTAQYVSDLSYRFMGDPSSNNNITTIIIAYTVSLVVFKDFTTYLVHSLMHKVPLLWEFHKVHHSATRLTPLTQYRIHPFELIINNLVSLLVIGLITGFFNYLVQGTIQVYQVLGANIVLLIFNFLGSNLRHSHVKLKYPEFLESTFISPYQHQIHHSDNPKFFNKNMGSIFAIWDFLFGTLAKSKEISKINFGLGRKENEKMRTPTNNVLGPIKTIIKRIFS
jgi:sterol desaturase/sphingolipid hydroxylase (fatty acid hydroxylase superfamily)